MDGRIIVELIEDAHWLGHSEWYYRDGAGLCLFFQKVYNHDLIAVGLGTTKHTAREDAHEAAIWWNQSWAGDKYEKARTQVVPCPDMNKLQHRWD